MNNFTEEYINLCKNSKLQELRPDFLRFDWYKEEGYSYPLMVTLDAEMCRSKGDIWLPTSNQLEEMIINFCKEHKLTCHISYQFFDWCTCYIYEPGSSIDKRIRFSMVESSINPLVAKLKILLRLL